MQTILRATDVVTLLQAVQASGQPDRSLALLIDMLGSSAITEWLGGADAPSPRVIAAAFVFDDADGASRVAMLTAPARELMGTEYHSATGRIRHDLLIDTANDPRLSFASPRPACVWRYVWDDGRWIWRCV